VAAHLKGCADCRQELAELREMTELYQAHPLPDPGPAFWQEFDRELHLKLAQVNQAPASMSWRPRLPHYILGATALAGVMALAVYLGPFTTPSSAPQLVHRQEEVKAKAAAPSQELRRARQALPAALAPPPAAVATKAAPVLTEKAEAPPALAAKPEATPAEEGEYSLATSRPGLSEKGSNGGEGLWPEDDILSWDVDAVVADLSREERQDLKRRLESRR